MILNQALIAVLGLIILSMTIQLGIVVRLVRASWGQWSPYRLMVGCILIVSIAAYLLMVAMGIPSAIDVLRKHSPVPVGDWANVIRSLLITVNYNGATLLMLWLWKGRLKP